MLGEPDITGQVGLHFFGKLSASISHEVKNILAVIGENAGLLQDLASLAERGGSIDPERLKRLSQDIMIQIQRADTIMKSLNQLAHSVDHRSATVELGEMIDLVTRLYGRFAFLKGVTLEKRPPAGPVMVATNPLMLENLIGLCIDTSTGLAGTSKTVIIGIETSDHGPRIRFAGLRATTGEVTGLFASKSEIALLAALKAVIEINPEAGELVLTLTSEICVQ